MTTTLWKLSTLVSASLAAVLTGRMILAPSPSGTTSLALVSKSRVDASRRGADDEDVAVRRHLDVARWSDELSRAKGAGPACHAIRALGHLGGDDAVAAIGEALHSRHAEPIKLCAIDALELVPTLKATSWLSEAARDSNRSVRTAAMSALVKSPDPSGHIVLIELSRSEDRERALEALLVLANAQVRDAVPELIAALPKLSVANLTEVLSALGSSGDPAAAPAIVDYTSHPSSSVRTAAIEALGTLGGEGAVSLLGGLLLHGRATDLSAVAKALASCGDESARKALFDAIESPMYAVSDAALQAVLELDSDDVAQLMVKLLGGAPHHLSVACEYFRTNPIPPAQLPTLIAMAGRGGEVGRASMTALAQQGGEQGRQAVLDLARKPGPGRVEALALLDQLAVDPDERRGAYISVLREGGNTASTAVALLSNDPSDEARAALEQAVRLGGPGSFEALRALGERSDPESERFLVDTAHGTGKPELRDAALQALGALGSPTAGRTILELSSSTDPRVRNAALRQLGQVSGVDPTPVIADAIEHGDPSRKNDIVGILGAMRGPTAVVNLERLSRDEDRSVRMNALSALVDQDPDKAMARVRDMMSSKDVADRVGAIEMMSSIPGMFERDALTSALKDPDPSLGSAAISALEAQGGTDAQEMLVGVLHRTDTSDSMKESAAASLDRLGGEIASRERVLIDKFYTPSVDDPGEVGEPGSGAEPGEIAQAPGEDDDMKNAIPLPEIEDED